MWRRHRCSNRSAFGDSMPRSASLACGEFTGCGISMFVATPLLVATPWFAGSLACVVSMACGNSTACGDSVARTDSSTWGPGWPELFFTTRPKMVDLGLSLVDSGPTLAESRQSLAEMCVDYVGPTYSPPRFRGGQRRSTSGAHSSFARDWSTPSQSLPRLAELGQHVDIMRPTLVDTMR